MRPDRLRPLRDLTQASGGDRFARRRTFEP